MKKKYRYAKIRDIIQKEVIETQEELAAALAGEGVSVTQATISRDIKELMLIKVPTEDGRYRYAVSPEQPALFAKDRFISLFQVTITSIQYSGNLVVIQTLPGSAQAVAYALDNTDIQEMIGTIAGDDTILLVVAEGKDPKKVKDRLYSFLREA